MRYVIASVLCLFVIVYGRMAFLKSIAPGSLMFWIVLAGICTAAGCIGYAVCDYRRRKQQK